MKHSPQKLLEKMQLYIDPHLVAPTCLKEITRQLGNFSRITTPFYGFEARLNQATPVADFYLFTYDWEELLAQLAAKNHWPAPPRVAPGAVTGIWAGYDLEKNEEPGPHMLYLSLGNDWRQHLAEEGYPATAFPCYDYFSPMLQAEKTAAVLGRCFACAEGLARVGELGYPLRKAAGSIRAQFMLEDKEKLLRFLTKLGMQHSVGIISEILAEVHSQIDYYVLHLDAAESLRPRIGLELRLTGMTTRDMHYYQPRWQAFLDRLKELDFCLPEKYLPLKQWQGRSREWGDAELFRYLTERFLCHFKFVFTAGRMTAVKCYFGFAHSRL